MENQQMTNAPPPVTAATNSNATEDALPTETISSDSKNLAVIFTLCSLFFGLFSPLLGYLMSSENPWLRKQMVELLNFEISVTISIVISMILNSTVVLSIVGFPLLFVALIGNFVYLILGAIKISKGEFRKYPWTIRVIS